VVLIVLGPAVWVDVMKHKTALFPYKNPAIFSITLAFVTTWLFSVTDNSKAAMKKKPSSMPSSFAP
jgi:cation/acetate symporter